MFKAIIIVILAWWVLELLSLITIIRAKKVQRKRWKEKYREKCLTWKWHNDKTVCICPSEKPRRKITDSTCNKLLSRSFEMSISFDARAPKNIWKVACESPWGTIFYDKCCPKSAREPGFNWTTKLTAIEHSCLTPLPGWDCSDCVCDWPQMWRQPVELLASHQYRQGRGVWAFTFGPVSRGRCAEQSSELPVAIGRCHLETLPVVI